MKKYLTGREGVLNFDSGLLEGDFRRIISQSSNCRDSRVFRVTEIANIPEDTPDFYSLDENDPRRKNIREMMMMSAKEINSSEPFDALIAFRETLFLRRKNPMDFLVPGREKGTYAVDCKKFVDSMDSRADFQCLELGFNFSKKMRAQIILDMYRRPDKYPSIIPGVNLKTYYQNLVAEIARGAQN